MRDIEERASIIVEDQELARNEAEQEEKRLDIAGMNRLAQDPVNYQPK